MNIDERRWGDWPPHEWAALRLPNAGGNVVKLCRARVAGGRRFLTLLKADLEMSEALSAAELEALFGLGYHTKHADDVFTRVLG